VRILAALIVVAALALLTLLSAGQYVVLAGDGVPPLEESDAPPPPVADGASNEGPSAHMGDVEDLGLQPLRIEAIENQTRGNVAYSDAIPAQAIVFADAASWHSFWHGLAISEVPDVDFAAVHVVALFLGPRGAGWGVDVHKVSYDQQEQRTIVYVVERTPNPDKVYPSVVIFPGIVVSYPARPGTTELVRVRTVDGMPG
jgi:hypothetical protein